MPVGRNVRHLVYVKVSGHHDCKLKSSRQPLRKSAMRIVLIHPNYHSGGAEIAGNWPPEW
jgi:hypothetical protein